MVLIGQVGVREVTERGTEGVVRRDFVEVYLKNVGVGTSRSRNPVWVGFCHCKMSDHGSSVNRLRQMEL